MKKKLRDSILIFSGSSGGTYVTDLGAGILTDVTSFPPNHQHGWRVRLTRDVKGNKSSAVIEAKDEAQATQWHGELKRHCGSAISEVLDCEI